jgi:hypothetical protein
MGLLDDAIREHLDLKRRRGADPGEIAREENDALGPVRRAEPEAAAPPDGERLDADYDDGEDFRYAAEPEAPDYDAPHHVSAEPPVTHEEPYAEPEAESATPPHGDPMIGQPTREFSTDELDEVLRQAPPADAPDEPQRPAKRDDAADGEGEDVLGETPDFLQETPEHDRLWFEQKPPKDFDF